MNTVNMPVQDLTPQIDCSTPLPPAVKRGLELFDARRYWHAHEALEEAWRAERAPIRDLYRGILQAGVTYLHIQRRNYRGAVKVYRRASRYLAQYPAQCCGIDVAQLRSDLDAAIEEIERLGPERLDEFDPGLFKPIQMIQGD